MNQYGRDLAQLRRIPKKLAFPFGWVVNIRELPDKEFEEECGDGCLACWIVDDMTIYLRKSRPIKKRRADLAHEMLHAAADWQAWLLQQRMADAA